uniref:Prolyl 4-hydroxylase alpha subunit Fe(2+) 2OG dioxygenase domain-containing protein n=1 Tax=viral metagenome TaxID=1070528 RepID=A0A6C0F7U5_9ZZZZ|tara:strand:- start:12204 stop:12935 length:732 start_codon:yes stop_codon:yes gene_type:complete
MIQTQTILLHSFSYPILKTDTLIEAKAYNELKNNWPKFSNFQTTSAGQVSRNNLELKKNNTNYNKIHPLFKNLYDEFNSTSFRDFLKSKMNLTIAKKEQGFIGDFDSSELVLHIAESKDGYENPWHVDTRGRIIQFLIYFGDETIEEGGELGIAKHKELESFLDYKQYPNKNNLEEIEYIQPKNNIGIFILSQNNSYHKGCSTKGLRRFIYAGYTNKSGHAWKTDGWTAGKNFSQRLKEEKSI